MFKRTTTRLALTAGALALAAVAGCRGDRSEQRPRQFLPDMDDSPKFKPQTKTEFFADGRAMRQPVEHAVAFGRSTNPAGDERAGFLKADTAYFFGKGSDGTYVPTMPGSAAVDQKVIARGQERYNIFCAACHGYDGLGKGTVGEQWAVPVANFHDPKYIDPREDQGKDGYLFHVIRNGLPADDPKQPMRMPAYGYSINESDAWAIVAYVRVLQAQRAGTPADLSPAARQALEAIRAAEIERARAERAKAAGGAAPAPATGNEVKP